jgi:hypothetical protein
MNRWTKVRLFQPESPQETLSLRPASPFDECKKTKPAYRYASTFQNETVEDFGNVNIIVEKTGEL